MRLPHLIYQDTHFGGKKRERERDEGGKKIGRRENKIQTIHERLVDISGR